ncbi:Sugar kinase of the NBD/HSP70 family, may contain an N-terminal HTH domain [Faunimonas pinastri]|uniref:Sugar kinase of the NBD/HSP70 family, may contain an N-terminal HTH domain n=1 Tax=Faunimonas pinastri TaxID=1855383 RepID=A0A1H9CKI7_9HYPH|nr:ROK family transcriptional regulator [Faunimonas pinastri]SEQ01720.1 Sugar kinase of the NBD/HSP70 family, may contain an N-terminal HTH domain [Faunimonas pinastri]
MVRSTAGRGTNSVQLRRYNERLILQILRRAGEASKAELARACDLTHSAVAVIIDRLEEAGLVTETGRRQDGSRGQPAALYRLDPKGAFGIGVRLDRRAMETVLVDLAGTLIARRSHDHLLPGPQEALAIVASDVRELLALLNDDNRERLAGIGVAQPYNLGSWLAELELADQSLGVWDAVDFPTLLEAEIGLPVSGENDGTAAAIAELFWGLGRSIDDFLYLFIGAAIGGGIVLDGDCRRGATGNAGDIAVFAVTHSHLPSAPPRGAQRDILLTRASLNSLIRHLRFNDQEASSRWALEQRIREGQPAVSEWLDDCVEALASVIWPATLLLDFATVVIDSDVDGGMINELNHRLASSLMEQAPEGCRPPRLMHGTFGFNAGAMGAASLPMFFNFSPRASILTRGANAGARNHAAAD